MKKGQALVEFVIILPIFILLVLGVIDIGNILYSKINLENKMSDVVSFYQSGKTTNEIEQTIGSKYQLSIKTENEYTLIELTKTIDIITPGLQFVFDNPYPVVTKRSILNE